MIETQGTDNKAVLPDLEEARLWEFERVSSRLLDFYNESKDSHGVSPKQIAQWIKLVDLLCAKARQSPYELPPVPELTKKDRRKWAAGWGNRWQDYKKLYDAHLARVARWEEEAQIADPTYRSKWQIAENRKKELQQLLQSDGWPPVERANWKFLPPGEWPKELQGWCKLVPCKSDFPPQPERLYFARSLGAVRIVLGKEGDFESYVAYHYPHTSKVLLESLEYGNAAYVLQGSWEQLSRLTKSDLNHYHWHEIQRVFHRDDGNWRDTIKQALNF